MAYNLYGSDLKQRLNPNPVRVLVGRHGVLQLPGRPDHLPGAARPVRALEQLLQLVRRSYTQTLQVRLLHLRHQVLHLLLLFHYRRLQSGDLKQSSQQR